MHELLLYIIAATANEVGRLLELLVLRERKLQTSGTYASSSSALSLLNTIYKMKRVFAIQCNRMSYNTTGETDGEKKQVRDRQPTGRCCRRDF